MIADRRPLGIIRVGLSTRARLAAAGESSFEGCIARRTTATMRWLGTARARSLPTGRSVEGVTPGAKSAVVMVPSARCQPFGPEPSWSSTSLTRTTEAMAMRRSIAAWPGVSATCSQLCRLGVATSVREGPVGFGLATAAVMTRIWRSRAPVRVPLTMFQPVSRPETRFASALARAMPAW